MIEFSIEAATIILLLAGIATYASCTAYRRRRIETIQIMAIMLVLMFIVSIFMVVITLTLSPPTRSADSNHLNPITNQPEPEQEHP